MARTQSRGELRRIPSVDSLLRTDAARRACEKFGRPLVKLAVQAVLGDARSALERDVEAPDDEILLARALRLTALNWYGLSTVLNATGVILHTGLGRAPLPERAARAAADAARNYVDLEADRERGDRGQAGGAVRVRPGVRIAAPVRRRAGRRAGGDRSARCGRRRRVLLRRQAARRPAGRHPPRAGRPRGIVATQPARAGPAGGQDAGRGPRGRAPY